MNFSCVRFAQVGMHLVDVLAQVRARGDLPDGYIRVAQQQAQQLSAGVAGSADNGTWTDALEIVLRSFSSSLV